MLKSLEFRLLATNTPHMTAEKFITYRLPKPQNNKVKDNTAMTSKSGFFS